MSLIRLITLCILLMFSFGFTLSSYANTVSTNTAPIDINSANAETLATLKGLGEKKAKAIVDYRAEHGVFKSVQDLTAVKGMSEKALAKILKNNPGRMVAKV